MAVDQNTLNAEFKKQFDRMLGALKEIAKSVDDLDSRLKTLEKTSTDKDSSKDIAALAKRVEALEKKK